MKRQQLRANSSGPENFIAVQAIAHQLLRTVLQASYIHTLPQSHYKTLPSICLSVGHLLFDKQRLRGKYKQIFRMSPKGLLRHIMLFTFDSQL